MRRSSRTRSHAGAAPRRNRTLSILTVNHHDAAALLEAQKALAAAPPACDYEWIVVNHSPEEPVAVLPALAERVRVIDQPNSGFGRGVNAAARAARGTVLFLANPDLVFDGVLLDGGLARLAEDPKVGLLAPRLIYPDGRVQRTARRFYRWRDALFARIPGRDALPAPRFWREHLMMDDPLDAPTDVDWIIGAALFVRVGALRDPKGPEPVFDPRYFLYFEDVDLAMDLWSRGWRVRFDPTLTAVHAHRRGSRNALTRLGWRHAQSFLKFVRKWGGLKARPEGKREYVGIG